MSERMMPQRKEAATSNFTNQSLTSANDSTLANVTPSISSQPDAVLSQTKIEPSSNLQEVQPANNEQIVEPETFKQSFLGHDIS